MAASASWSVLVPAAGTGERIGRGPKLELTLGGRTFLDRVLEVALGFCDDVIVGVHETVESRLTVPGCRFVVGGPTRQETVRRLLDASRREWLVIHDVARPLASPALFGRVAEAAARTGAAAAVGPVDVPVALIDEGCIVGARPAAGVGLFQTPLAFHRDVLAAAYAAAEAEGRAAQSTVELVLAAGTKVVAVPGERSNFKVTTPDDLVLAEALATRSR